MSDFMNNARGFGKRLWFNVKRRAPEICTYLGIGSFVAGTITACKQTTKLNSVLDANDERVADVRAATIGADERTKKHELRKAKARNVLDIAGLYVVPAGLTGAGAVLTASGTKILRKENYAIAAAYTALAAEYMNYKNLSEESMRLAFADPEETRSLNESGMYLSVEPDPETKESKIKVNLPENPEWVDPDRAYTRLFSEDTSQYFRRNDTLSNLTFLKAIENFANDKLRTDGFLLLNDVLDSLGFPKTVAGGHVGWKVRKPGDPNGDGFVDFGIDRFLQGTADFADYEFLSERIPVKFNVDGEILDSDSMPLF